MLTYNFIHRLTFLVCSVFMLYGCALKEPPPFRKTLTKTLADNTKIRIDWVASANTGKVDDNWLKNFQDQRLEALAAEVLKYNQNLQAAAAQVEAAAALAKQAGAALKPAIGLSANTSSKDADSLPSSLESSNALLNFSWELDIWGRIRAGKAAAKAAYRATEADYKYARQSLVAQTTKAWFLATQIRAQLKLAQEAVTIYSKLVALVELRQKIGKAQPQDLPLAKANLAGANNNLRQIQSSYQEILRSIEVILGRYPAAELQAAPEYVAVLSPIPVGLPSEILERRADLIAAERRVAAAFFGSQQARAARLPRISLTAAAGGIDSGLADLLNVDNPVTALTANLFAPLYAGGALKAGVEFADARQRAVMAVYAQTALLAFREVETSLTNEQLLKTREAYLQEVVNKTNEAYLITHTQYAIGRLDFLTVLQVQAKLLSARSSLIAIRNERLAQRVTLHLALGGSFETRNKN